MPQNYQLLNLPCGDPLNTHDLFAAVDQRRAISAENLSSNFLYLLTGLGVTCKEAEIVHSAPGDIPDREPAELPGTGKLCYIYNGVRTRTIWFNSSSGLPVEVAVLDGAAIIHTGLEHSNANPNQISRYCLICTLADNTGEELSYSQLVNLFSQFKK